MLKSKIILLILPFITLNCSELNLGSSYCKNNLTKKVFMLFCICALALNKIATAEQPKCYKECKQLKECVNVNGFKKSCCADLLQAHQIKLDELQEEPLRRECSARYAYHYQSCYKNYPCKGMELSFKDAFHKIYSGVDSIKPEFQNLAFLMIGMFLLQQLFFNLLHE